MEDLDVAILCGGAGTRFQAVFENIPKALAPIGNRPFLDIILEFFRRHGYHRQILCLGHQSEFIKNYYRRQPYPKKRSLIFSEESKPLGTGGAVKNAQPYIQSKNFFVVNGDSYCQADLPGFHKFHLAKPDALISLVVAKSQGRADGGGILLDESTQAITAFTEKSLIPMKQKPFINAGIYLFNKKVLDDIPPEQNYSLEYQLFPSLVNHGLYGFPTSHEVIDIGTAERYQKAIGLLKAS